MKCCILKNEDPRSHVKWESSCLKQKIPYSIVDLTSNDWYEKVLESNADVFLLKPPGETFRFKNLYDERLFILSEIMGKFLFPKYKEALIYENKRLLSDFLKSTSVPMPKTYVFYNLQEALLSVKNIFLPIVAKTTIGASGSGVTIIRDKKKLIKYIKKAFNNGIRRRLGPNRNTGNLKTWSKKAYLNPSFFLSKIKKYLNIYKDSQKGFVILQEYIPHDFEWRIVKIGDSWFGHQKVKSGDKASGTKGIDYIQPNEKLLNFCDKICERNGFNTMAIDLFERSNGDYVVNELQTIFGHVQSHILEVDGKIGRFKKTNGVWIFEQGDFNTNESYDLRLETAIKLFQETKDA